MTNSVLKKSGGMVDGNSLFGSLDIDCEFSNWGDWSKCNVTEGTCGYGYKEKHRIILVGIVYANKQKYLVEKL